MLLTCDISEGDQVYLFRHHTAELRYLFRPSADVCVQLCNGFGFKLCIVSPTTAVMLAL